MKKSAAFVLMIWVNLMAVHGQGQRIQNCRLQIKNTDDSKEVIHYLYDKKQRLIAMVYHFAAIGDVIPASVDSHAIIYNPSGKVSRKVEFNGKMDTLEMSVFDYAQTGRLLRIHTLNRKSGIDNNIRETSYKEFGEMVDNQVKITNYSMAEGHSEPQMDGYTIAYLNASGNVDYEKSFHPGEYEAYMTETFTYDDKTNAEYYKMYQGEPVNDNFNNITVSEIKSINDGLHGTMKTIYEYNAEGYPTKATYMDGEEVYSTVKYTWVCK